MTGKAAEATDLKPSRAEKRLSLRQDRLTLLRELRIAAKGGDIDVWTRLGDTKNAPSKDLKAQLRKSLKARQEPRCCYCKRWLLNNAHASPIEHILPRKHYPEFALRARNLAIACNDCNSLKSDADWGNFTGSPKVYPSPATMHFFHPRYHFYDEHIRYLRMETNRQEFVTYHGLTPQGQHLCTKLLSRVVGKINLKKSYPQLAGWLRTLEEFDTEPQSTSRPALQAFRDAMDKAIAERLDDGDNVSALWIVPDESQSTSP
ncbi:HNH endonuclease [Pseudomonas sp. NFACC13-1]|uniref:HNH endonuclease n=1 Tax=Pseudomonas sp. NFACC13-1 TaxID=1566245 RepID=UPI00088B87CC|nr:hypothetical protein [Pseudomonas sp. NFACC13-1]SDB35425.1 TIGR02646 family protein [Pseudomonas sp. NFACC13-1]